MVDTIHPLMHVPSGPEYVIRHTSRVAIAMAVDTIPPLTHAPSDPEYVLHQGPPLQLGTTSLL